VPRVTTVDFACRAGRAAPHGDRGEACELLAWAASGGMALTGWPDRPPRPPPSPVLRRSAQLAAALADATSRVGERVEVDVAATLFGRAALLGGQRGGATSVGGSCQLLRAADGWVAVNLPRAADVEVLPALVGRPVVDPWAALAEHARVRTAAAFAARAQELAIPCAEVGARHEHATGPGRARRMGGRRRAASRPLVVDLSAMWAGPLAASLLARAGARVVKVESATRPDGARRGPPAFFDELHAGHDSVTLDFATSDGRARLHALLARADAVIEASRPRALAQLGVDAGALVRARPGLTWVSITAYGRTGPWANRVGFGDDVAAAAGLLARDDAGDPVFCGDALADPVAGLVAALGAATATARGGGVLVDVSLAGAAAWLARPLGAPASRHRITEVGPDRWVVHHGAWHTPVATPRAPRPVAVAQAAGAATDRVFATLDPARPTRTRSPSPPPSRTRLARPHG
jgi:crotonobetainyl-CoA:carnitine CoA-transferase CaiB-like acyl-CoA transferase